MAGEGATGDRTATGMPTMGTAWTAVADADPVPEAERLRGVGETVTGVVLAGGLSRRMGFDKAWAPLAGKPLIQWVIDALAVVTDTQLVVARERGTLDRLGLPVVLDRSSARGALAGIYAGLTEAPTDLCLVVACDLPLVRPELLALLASEIGPSGAAIPNVGATGLPLPIAWTRIGDAGPQPLLAAYRRRAADALEPLLGTGSLPAAALLGVLQARLVAPERWRLADPDGRSFFNVNTPDDVSEAARILAGGR